MAARKATSKKPSGANSSSKQRLNRELTFFLDRDLGRFDVANALRGLGANVEIHSDHFPPASPDTEWLPEVGKRGWIVLTRDRHILTRSLEIIALLRANTHAFILKNRNEMTGEVDPSAFLCFKDVTSPTNQRTMIAAMTPIAGIVNSAPITITSHNCARSCCLLANLNSYSYDFVMRQKISNVHLNFFIVEQIPTLPPDAYTKPPKTTLETWISERVLKLTCTAEGMLPLAEACDFS
ncbi:MAG: hypothetical protein GXP24_10510 [Planctomycetes bacterium]|nr:hypothetical protein [Planctomycetota bacterium]